MPDNPYYGFAKESTQGTTLSVSEQAMPSILDHATLPIGHDVLIIAVKAEYNGKRYQGMLYPAEDKES